MDCLPLESAKEYLRQTHIGAPGRKAKHCDLTLNEG